MLSVELSNARIVSTVSFSEASSPKDFNIETVLKEQSFNREHALVDLSPHSKRLYVSGYFADLSQWSST